jgi:hypothetical protein
MTHPKTSMERAREIMNEMDAWIKRERDEKRFPGNGLEGQYFLENMIATELDKQAKLIEALRKEANLAQEWLDTSDEDPRIDDVRDYWDQARKERLELERGGMKLESVQPFDNALKELET